MRLIGVDLFAGAGGLSLGFEQAGFDVVAAVEIDPIHAAIHRFNFPRCSVLAKSVIDLGAEEIRRASGIGHRTVDVVFGGAPCQGFSLIGHRALNDPRNLLVGHFVRLVKELDASYFVFENVKGLTVGGHQTFLHEIIDEFDRLGYACVEPWRVLDAAEFGVPQHRERLFLLGAKKGLPLPSYPSPTHRPADSQKASPLPWGPTCQDALGDLPDAEDFDDLIDSDEVRAFTWGKASHYASILRGLLQEPADYSARRLYDRVRLTSSARTEHTVISRRRFEQTGEGAVEPISRFYKLPRAGLSNTLRAGTDGARGAFTSPRPIHYNLPRCVTVREMARLHSFPDWFRLHATKWHGARQIGNSVPPLLGRAVASEVLKALGVGPERPTEVQLLTEERLLTMSMMDAASEFDVPAPMHRRDRKSGARKRKQSEIEALQDATLNAKRYA